MDRLLAELYGKATGINGGLAGSQDISDPARNFYAGAILSGAVAIATGAARGLKGSGNVVVAACGEGATDEGIFWEALNYAALERLPIVFLIENNQYATFSHQNARHSSLIAGRVRAFGVPMFKVDGNNATEVLDLLSNVLRSGPVVIEAATYRTCPHVGVDDVQGYRTDEEVAEWKARDPIARLAKELRMFSPPEFPEITEEIHRAFQLATLAPFPGSMDYERTNWELETPEADRLLVDLHLTGAFNPHQAEATLAPY